MIWRVISESVQGASHKRYNKPNQDAEKHVPLIPDEWAIVALADGHGGESYFRSDRGSKMAVESAIEVCKNHLKSIESIKSISKQDLMAGLCKDVVISWQKLVHEDYSNAIEPLNNRDNELPQSTGNKQNPILTPYGSTLIIVIATKEFQIYLQLGDGNILTVNEKGDVTPVFPYQSELGDDTLSLILPNCSDDFKVEITHEPEEIPFLILVSTDGYAKSFQDQMSFEQVASDFFNILKDTESNVEDGIKVIEDNLCNWLEETSTLGSGDDITVGLLIQQ